MAIKHIEDLKPQVLLDFFKSWNSTRDFSASEKIDGSYLAFGLKDERFYIRSKNKIFFDVKEIPNIFFMESFKRFYEFFEKVPFDEITKKLSKRYEFWYNGNIEIEGEVVPSYDHNIIIYDEKKIGDGIFVIFGITIEGQKNNNQTFWEDLAQEINKNTSVKTYPVPQIDLSDFEFDNKLVVSLGDLLEKHGNFLKKPARKPEAKELKQKLLAAVKEIGIQAKQQIIKSGFIVSLFGEECEGIVIETSNGDLIKVVDKETFTQRKNQNWYFIDFLQRAQRVFRKTVKTNSENLREGIAVWEQELQRIKQDFNQNKNNFFTIPRKEQDTKNFIELDTFVIESMKGMLQAGLTSEEVIRKYQQKEITSKRGENER